MRKLAWITVLPLFLVLAGCMSPQSVKQPSITLGNVRVLETRGLIQRLQIDLLVGNPNDFDIPLTGLEFTMQLNGLDFAQGLSNETVTIPRLGEATVPVDVSVSLLAVIQQMQAAANAQGIRYRITGKAYLDHALVSTVPFAKQGQLVPGDDPLGKGFKPL